MLIGFSGKIGYGKSVTAHNIAALLNGVPPQAHNHIDNVDSIDNADNGTSKNFVVVSFADALRDEVKIVSSLIDEAYNSNDKQNSCEKFVQLMLNHMRDPNPKPIAGEQGCGGNDHNKTKNPTMQYTVHNSDNSTGNLKTSVEVLETPPSPQRVPRVPKKALASKKFGGDVLAFAPPELLASFYSKVHDHMKNDPDRKAFYRFLLQEWGTGVRRAQDENYWVDSCMATVQKHTGNGVGVIIDDVRFINEADSIISHGGVVIRLTIDPDEQLRRLAETRGHTPNTKILNHPSETGLDTYKDFALVVDMTNPSMGQQRIMSFIQQQVWAR